jgi:trypsin
VLSGSSDTMKQWDVATRQPMRTLEGYFTAFSRNGDHVLSDGAMCRQRRCEGNKVMRSVASFLAIVVISLPALGISEPLLAQETIKLGGRRIVGGEPTDIKQHPWQVALTIGNNLCGGSIVAQKWVLTAAHCVKPSPKLSEVKVKSDATDYTRGGTWTAIEKIVVHESYNPFTNEHDLALIKLKAATAGRVIPLASEAPPMPNSQPLEVTGWGRTAEGGNPSTSLLKASVPYVDNVACNVATAYNGSIKSGMLCAGYRDGGVDSCQGDSGGPLVLRTTDGPVLVGVVSYGEGCARKLKYGVYTRVSSYRDWIDRIVATDRN